MTYLQQPYDNANLQKNLTTILRWKSAQRLRQHCALAVVRWAHKETHKQTRRQGRLQYTAQLSAQCNKS